MPYDAHHRTDLSKLDRALIVVAALVARYQGTSFETDAVGIFERVERERAKHLVFMDAKSRALSLLEASE